MSVPTTMNFTVLRVGQLKCFSSGLLESVFPKFFGKTRVCVCLVSVNKFKIDDGLRHLLSTVFCDLFFEFSFCIHYSTGVLRNSLGCLRTLRPSGTRTHPHTYIDSDTHTIPYRLFQIGDRPEPQDILIFLLLILTRRIDS